MKRGLIGVVLALAACGVDGAPVRPSVEANVGVGQSGVHSSTRVAATKGNVTVGVGLGL